jgi:hypothetical protein
MDGVVYFTSLLAGRQIKSLEPQWRSRNRKSWGELGRAQAQRPYTVHTHACACLMSAVIKHSSGTTGRMHVQLKQTHVKAMSHEVTPSLQGDDSTTLKGVACEVTSLYNNQTLYD